MKFYQGLFDFFGKQNICVKICLLFLAFLIMIQSVGLFSYYRNSGRLSAFDPWQPLSSNSTVPLLARWDSGWYISIVSSGYSLRENRNSNVVFFPLYPLLISGVSKIIPINFFYLGQYISWLALAGALFYFYKLLRLDYSGNQSLQALLYLLIFPWSFFLAAVYTESLFLMLMLASFYYARKKNWPLASLFGFLASLTRISGLLLLPALFYEFYAQNKSFKTKKVIWLSLVPCGLAVFMVYLKIKTGYFLAFLYNQETFGRKYTFPLSTIWIDIKNTIIFLKDGDSLKTFIYGFSLLILGLCAILIIKKVKQIRASYLIFAFLSILLPLSTGTTTSLGRYLLSAFPIFIALSLVKNQTFKNIWFILSFTVLTIMTFYFVGWYFIV